MGALRISILILLLAMVVVAHSNSKDGYSNPLSAVLHDYEPSMDDSIANLLKVGIENGIILNQPALCKLAGFYCPHANPRVSKEPFTPRVRKALMRKVSFADEKTLVEPHSADEKTLVEALPHSSDEINIQEMKMVANMVFRLESLKVDASIRLPQLVHHNLFTKFLHPALQNVLAFSEKNLPQLLTLFGLTPDSKFSNIMKLVLQECNDKNIPSSIEIRKCSISSQEVMQGASSLLEDEVIACKAKPNSDCNLKSLVASIHDSYEMVKISNVQLMANSSIICHPLQFPYIVFACHKIVETKLFQVTMETSGGRFAAPVACHMKTEGFVTSHPAFKVLNIKPGGGEICHWVRPGAIALYV